MDKDVNIIDLKEKVKLFCEERDWDQFHSPKDLAIGVITEASELLELFRFKNLAEQKELFLNKDKKYEISLEVADIFFFLLRFSQMYNVDLSESLIKKMDINTKRYSVEKSKGSNKKYSEL
jgi:NTP pyrophosphatase (non-canonical NTP hydrolase)